MAGRPEMADPAIPESKPRDVGRSPWTAADALAGLHLEPVDIGPGVWRARARDRFQPFSYFFPLLISHSISEWMFKPILVML